MASRTPPAAHAGADHLGRQRDADASDRAAAMAIPSSFFGLSTEYWTLPVDLRYTSLYRQDDLAAARPGRCAVRAAHRRGLLRPHLLRPGRRADAPWTFALTPAFVQRTAAVVRAMKLHVILDLNLVTGTPELAAAWAREAETVMPRGQHRRL